MNITSNTVREKLLSKAELKLAETIDICRSSEITGQLMAGMSQHEQSLAMKGTSSSRSRDNGNDSWQRSKNRTRNDHHCKAKACKSCGTTHAARNCPAYCTGHMLLITWLITLSSKFRHYSNHRISSRINLLHSAYQVLTQLTSNSNRETYPLHNRSPGCL